MSALTRICALLAACLIIGCAPTLQINAPEPLDPTRATLAAEQPERDWWRMRFKLVWPEGAQPDFSRHLLIAEQLYLSVGTVRNHVSAIFTKLEVQDRTQAAIIAIRHGLAD